MNSFSFRHVKHQGQFLAEYRLAHWKGPALVRGSDDKPIVFSSAADASLHAATALVNALNGRIEYWHGPSTNEAKANAEKYFKGLSDGKD